MQARSAIVRFALGRRCTASQACLDVSCNVSGSAYVSAEEQGGSMHLDSFFLWTLQVGNGAVALLAGCLARVGVFTAAVRKAIAACT